MKLRCKSCKNGIYEAKYGMYHCPHVKFRADETPDCGHYEEGIPKEHPDNEAYYQEMDYKENEE